MFLQLSQKISRNNVGNDGEDGKDDYVHDGEDDAMHSMKPENPIPPRANPPNLNHWHRTLQRNPMQG